MNPVKAQNQTCVLYGTNHGINLEIFHDLQFLQHKRWQKLGRAPNLGIYKLSIIWENSLKSNQLEAEVLWDIHLPNNHPHPEKSRGLNSQSRGFCMYPRIG